MQWPSRLKFNVGGRQDETPRDAMKGGANTRTAGMLFLCLR